MEHKTEVRADYLEKVTGKAMFVTDMVVPGMAYARLIRSTHAHAKIVAIDVTEAQALPGVLGVFSGEDLERLFGDNFRRSEEHTSELQSRGHLVCRLLLENKKI